MSFGVVIVFAPQAEAATATTSRTDAVATERSIVADSRARSAIRRSRP
jgi:hypothetical protein